MAGIIRRRRLIGIAAAAAGLPLLPRRASAAEGALVTWKGAALGSPASIEIHHPDRPTAERLVALALGEVRRLERIFSIYREDSTLSALNRSGVLVAPPSELVDLLEHCRTYGVLTGGAFDPTVQPLWNLYLAHFGRRDADPKGPPREAIDSALAKVGMDGLAISRDRIVFRRPGMGVTLNGIAQGYLTDRILELFRAEGITRTLVDLGESRALGRRGDGTPWIAALEDPDDPTRIDTTIDLTDRALATSGPYGFRFAPDGAFNHLFDPHSGGCANLVRSVSVVMSNATAADAFATAFCLMPPDAISKTLAAFGEGEVHLVAADGGRHAIG